ncbi:MAG: M16 family metallopeptidase [Nitrospiraceae bacterium]
MEHMFFKGTTRRSAADISREIDGLGGEINAFTGRETTTFYVTVLDQHLDPALRLLADLFHHSRFDSKEIEKEKQVVLEEIRMAQDDPEGLVQELHTQQALARHPLGRPILGEAATIKALRRQEVLKYIRNHYDPRQTVIAVAGNFNQTRLEPLLGRRFGSFHHGCGTASNRWPPESAGGLVVNQKPLEQVHVCIGIKGLSAGHKDRYALHALNSVLGGSVSSRLFQEVREKRALAYSIYSYLSTFSDGGTLTVYTATRAKEVRRVVELVCRELGRLRSAGVDPKELVRAKNQMKGNLMLGLESSHSRMTKLAKDELYHGVHTSLEEMLTQIDRVSGEQVLRLCRELLDMDTLSLTALGPVPAKELQAAMS